jgi:putative hemolysin
MCNTCCSEPSLDELFRDDSIQLLMSRDGAKESDVRALLDEVARARSPDV